MPVEIEIKKKPYGKTELGVIPVPAGLEIPEGLGPDETFDLTTSYVLTPEGKLKARFIEGLELTEGEESEVEEEDMEDEGRDMFMEGLSNQMSRTA